MEWLDVVNENGEPTGERVSREEAHEKGIRHRTSHVWLIRKREGRLQVLLQKRSANKDSHPGCYDASSAGHIPAGDDYEISALRELQEELGVVAQVEDLLYVGVRTFSFQKKFYGKPFVDNQVSRVYCMWCEKEESEFQIQKEELESVCWMDFEECKKSLDDPNFPNCIFPEELELIENGIVED